MSIDTSSQIVYDVIRREVNDGANMTTSVCPSTVKQLRNICTGTLTSGTFEYLGSCCLEHWFVTVPSSYHFHSDFIFLKCWHLCKPGNGAQLHNGKIKEVMIFLSFILEQTFKNCDVTLNLIFPIQVNITDLCRAFGHCW